MTSIATTDLYTYILDAIPSIHIVLHHVATDKHTTANGGTFTSSSASFTANHVKACRAIPTGRNLINLR